MNSANAGAGTPGRGKLGAFLDDIAPFFYKTPIVYVDAGAHSGDMLREIVRSDLKIHEAHLVEPNPVSFARLRETVRELDAEAVATCHELALSDAPGRLLLRDADTMTKVVGPEAGLPPEDKVVEAEADTLDALARRMSIERISVLKIDVEGFETRVLAGAAGLLGAQAVDIVYVEAGMDPCGVQQTYCRDIEDVLLGHGYRHFRIYEQMHEWLEDSPLLRRINIAFMSRRFAERQPYQLLIDLRAARSALAERSRDLSEIEKMLAGAEAAREKALEKEARMAEALEAAEKRIRDGESRAAEALAAAEAETAAQAASLRRRFEEIAALTGLAEKRGRAAETAEAVGARKTRDLDAAKKKIREIEKAAEALGRKLAWVRNYARDLEKKHLAMLGSTTWRVMEPPRRLMRLATGKGRTKPFAPRYLPGKK